MGKVKSAIITTLLVVAVIVLALFATVSCGVPGSNGVKRYNSFISNIKLGSDFTGEAYAMLYPEGVISTADYELVVNDNDNANRDKYLAKYLSVGGVFVDKTKIGYDYDVESEEYVKGEDADKAEQAFKDSIAKDAEIISKRFGGKGYSSYSVAVEDGYCIKVSVPTEFTYAEYNGNDSSARSAQLSDISHTVQYLMLDGKLGLRNGTDYSTSKSLVSIKDDFGAYFKSVSMFSIAGNYSVKMTLTDEGFEKINACLIAAGTEGSAYIYVGETNLGLNITVGEALTEKTLYYTQTESYAQDFSILISSVISGKEVANSYNGDSAHSGTDLVATTPSFGEWSAIYLLVALLLVIVGAVAASIVIYKKLGLVNGLMVVIFALAMVCAFMLIGIELTMAGAFTAVLGLALLMFSNVYVFEAVRKETKAGRTIQASVKTGYKKTLTTILDMHIILLVASLMLTLIGVGEVASCGFIFFIATIASYALYWFTRLIWFVISSPVRDKFAFCGYEREVYEDED